MELIKWHKLPKEIQEKMLDEQERQGNKRNAEFFISKGIFACKHSKGFTWRNSIDGSNFWERIILEEDFSEFYKKYPKKELTFPRVMLVSDNGDDWKERVVFFVIEDMYMAWIGTKNDVKIYRAKGWKYAKELKTILTKEEIAKRLNINIDSFDIAL